MLEALLHKYNPRGRNIAQKKYMQNGGGGVQIRLGGALPFSFQCKAATVSLW